MRRRKDDKRVLRPGNGRNSKRNRRTPNLSFSRNNKSRRNNPVRQNNRVKKQNKRSKKTVLLMIMVLFAFVIGAGAGVLMSFDDGNENNETHIQNVTIEMTSNLTNDSNQVTFDEGDDVDYNQNSSSGILGAEDNPYYNDDGH